MKKKVRIVWTEVATYDQVIEVQAGRVQRAHLRRTTGNPVRSLITP